MRVSSLAYTRGAFDLSPVNVAAREGKKKERPRRTRLLAREVAECKRPANSILTGDFGLWLFRAKRVVRTHLTRGAGFFHRRFEVAVHGRIFVLEFDLPAPLLHAGVGRTFAVLHSHEAKAPATPAERQIARRFCAGVQMLMKPLVRRHHDAPWLPVHALHLLALQPENGVTLAAENDHVSPGSVAVGFFVGPHRKLRDMRRHGLVCKI